MTVLSVNIGQPRWIEWEGNGMTTGIFKDPVPDRRHVSFLSIEGDAQADLNVHGGRDKAVYAYDIDHYRHWKTLLHRVSWEMGLFGENLTTEELPDHDVRIGDVYRIGTVTLRAVQPRFPCSKLNARFALPDMVERFRAQQRNGIYFRVLEEGFIQQGDEIALLERSPFAITISDVIASYNSDGKDREQVTAILQIPYIPERLKLKFQTFL